MSYLDHLDEFVKEIQDLGITFFKEEDISLGQKIGKGGTGTVYKGSLKYNEDDIIDVVAKKYSSNNYYEGYEGDIYEEAHSELEMLSHLMNEEKIIEVYGFTYSKRCDGSLKIYILLESLNAKGDLYDFLREPLYWEESDGERYFSMSEKKKREICIKMCECVQDLHKNKIIHCDLKTSNMICYSRGLDKGSKSIENDIKLIDFGASFMMDTNKISEVVGCDCELGTEGYMAPELKNGLGGYKTDIYSLGVCILEVWSGDIWLDGEAESYSECRKDVLRSLKNVKDKNLSKILQRCISKDMKIRPPISSIIKALNTS